MTEINGLFIQYLSAADKKECSVKAAAFPIETEFCQALEREYSLIWTDTTQFL